jgi:hypothetical protein
MDKGKVIFRSLTSGGQDTTLADANNFRGWQWIDAKDLKAGFGKQ